MPTADHLSPEAKGRRTIRKRKRAQDRRRLRARMAKIEREDTMRRAVLRRIANDTKSAPSKVRAMALAGVKIGSEAV